MSSSIGMLVLIARDPSRDGSLVKWREVYRIEATGQRFGAWRDILHCLRVGRGWNRDGLGL